ncbi:hypothetical protein [Saccharopolyspora mangrovi]|uniref:Mycothiol-dependent maleylpyruvate isomerase metal-binding domain-containing protein n=1 Tax=Saccharopolyspora mangrovi TaxID=3082379 RepID=A0ABU6AEA7_9PSEU|nr:hypothetical protein [Saccharopolyspora sp. S2-29]MEB3369808.1 hypothetical protein [Saccharopolyspora sp. S2-29]
MSTTERQWSVASVVGALLDAESTATALGSIEAEWEGLDHRVIRKEWLVQGCAQHIA